MATLGMLFASLLGVLYRRGQTKAFWVGSSIFGWAYLTLALGPLFISADGRHFVTTPQAPGLD